jgi:uroporphyrinogen decarboxylase
MNKIQRVDAVLNGQEVDRPPISFWYHFGIQHASGEQFAKIALEFFDYYDLDFLKVMNDYLYPMPEGLRGIKSKDDLMKLARFKVEPVWKEQFKALEIIRKALEGKAYFIDTAFDPWLSIKRHLSAENINFLMEEEPDALLEALDTVSENLINYSKRALEIGAAGIFMAVPATRESVTREQFLKFVKPYDRKVFKAISGLGKMNTAHIHGEDLYIDDCLDYPVDIFNWWDRGPNGPSLESVKSRIKGCVMGGIDHKLSTQRTPAFLKEHTKEGIELGGKTRFFMANGCSIDTWVYPEAVHAMVEAAREAVA